MISAIVVVNKRSNYLLDCVKSLREAGTDVEITLYNVGDDSAVGSICLGLKKSGSIDHLMMGDRWPTLYNSYCHGLDFVRSQNPDVILLTADDYVYRQGWGAELEAFLSGSKGVSHCSCELEPLFPWNIPTEIVEHNGVKALSRATLPGANWAFTAEAGDRIIKPLLQAYQDDQQADHMLNNYVREKHSLKLCALNLAEHVGAYDSEVGNMAFQIDAKPLPDHWQI